MIGLLLLVGTALALAPVAASGDPPRIFGGTEVSECSWPSVVSVGDACTGTLVHPSVVVYASHCGIEIGSVTFGEVVLGGHSVPVEYCESFPIGERPEGMDFAYCVLASPKFDVPIVPPLLGCEIDLISAGQPVVLVGFGLDDDGTTGVKQATVAEYHYVSDEDEAFIGGEGHDSCVGDSGGPAFVRLIGPDGERLGYRQLGVASYGGACGAGGFYSLMRNGIPWLEERLGLDVSPCHSPEGDWQPSAMCTRFPVAPELGRGTWVSGCEDERGSPSQSCGPPFDSSADLLGPSVVWAAAREFLLEKAGGVVLLEAFADDGDGVGVAEVTFLVDQQAIPAHQVTATEWVAESPLAPGEYVFRILAVDHGGNASYSDSVPVEVISSAGPDEGKGCAVSGRSRTVWPTWLVLVLVLVPMLVRRSRRALDAHKSRRKREHASA